MNTILLAIDCFKGNFHNNQHLEAVMGILLNNKSTFKRFIFMVKVWVTWEIVRLKWVVYKKKQFLIEMGEDENKI